MGASTAVRPISWSAMARCSSLSSAVLLAIGAYADRIEASHPLAAAADSLDGILEELIFRGAIFRLRVASEHDGHSASRPRYLDRGTWLNPEPT